ncbi:MAG: IS1634 family transposase [Desulfobulbaceae bacterium]|nr:IS1634 family transposase [Desulfobulbaceae bacterium]
MAHIHKKIKKGRPYYYVRETGRVKGKTKVLNQVYLGSPEKILQMATETKTSAMPSKIQSQEFGALWLAHLVESDIDVAELIDDLVPQKPNRDEPSVGEYFLYAIYNRMIDACSKRALPAWYRHTAIQHIRPADIQKLTSQMYWQKWHQVGDDQLQQIATEFLRRVAKLEQPSSDCFMFDTTNYYTFMASYTPSELAKRGKNKEGRNWLRQIGVALLVCRSKRLPLFYREYEGNRHDSKVFLQVMNDVFTTMRETVGKQSRMTVVFDKGMNAEENIAAIDANEQINFITTYSTYFAEDLVHIDLSKFTPVDTRKNRKLHKYDRDEDRLVAWRTTGDYWNRQRTVVVTYNPITATKQRFRFEKKMLRLQEILYDFQAKVNQGAPHWRNKTQVLARYNDACAQLHIAADLYTVEVYENGKSLRMNFRKNHYRIGRHIDRFGKNIIITDNADWSTDDIVNASLDRWTAEDGFRQSKNDDLVAMMPFRHWTDSKIKCHVFTCIAAYALLRLLEIKLRRADSTLTAQAAMKQMSQLHSVLIWLPKRKTPERMIEEPDEEQAQILGAFGWEIKGGALQNLRS